MAWNGRSRRARLMLGVALLVCAITVLRPGVAHAGWPLRVRGSVVLGFGATYRAMEATSSSTHRGIDVAAETGARVLAPLEGHVTFAGRVPAVGGGTVQAVSISTAAGTVTLLPLAALSVAKGDDVGDGDVIGTVADAGDGSCAGTHLHVGIKRDDLYIDPLAVLTLPGVAPEHQSSVQEDGSRAEDPKTAAATGHASATALAPTPATTGLAAGSVAFAAQQAPATLRSAMPGSRLSPGVSVGGVAPQVASGAAAGAGVASLSPLRAVGLVPADFGAGAQAADTMVGRLFVGARRAATRAGHAAAVLAASVLAGVGLLWPLWRRGERKGCGEDRVSALEEDVAAVVGR